MTNTAALDLFAELDVRMLLLTPYVYEYVLLRSNTPYALEPLTGKLSKSQPRD